MIFAPHRIEDYDENTILLFSIIFIPFILFAVILTLYVAKFKIIVKKDSFIYINLFKRTKTYSYDNVYSTLIGGRSYHCYQNGKRIVIISFLLNNCDLLHKSIEDYQKKNKITPKDEHNGVIKRTKLWVVISLCYFVLCALINLICGYFYDAWWWYFTLLCHIPNLPFIASCLAWKITIRDGVLTKRSLFGNKRYNIEELTYTANSTFVLYKIYRGEKRIAFVLAVEYDSSLIEAKLKCKHSIR